MEIRRLLETRDHDALRSWGRTSSNALSKLATQLFDPEPLVRWRTIEALGILAAEKAHQGMDKVRAFMRRLFWLMNDESGGICWHAPEAIAHLMVCIPDLVPEYGVLLMSFLVEEPFEAGTCWGVHHLHCAGLLSPEMAEAASKHAETLLMYTRVDSPAELRAHALKILLALDVPIPPTVLSALSEDNARFFDYDFTTGQLVERSVASVMS
jgi:hypothetical protein